MKMAGRLEAMGSPIYRGHTTKTKAGFVWNGKVAASNWGQVIKPLSWKKPRRIFVNSMSDLFHDDMPVEVIDQVFAVMALCPQHTFQVLTKRFSRMRDYCLDRKMPERVGEQMGVIGGDEREGWYAPVCDGKRGWVEASMPLPNVWLGASVENQEAADYRIPALLETPAAVRFLSCEPLLGPIVFSKVPGFNRIGLDLSNWWVICGGESGPGKRPMDLAWARSLRDQCAGPGVPFFMKQIDKIQPIPPDLMIRQFPSAAR
jgi:protein gp37